jgi:pyruvate dehydrogenase (quinone)
MAKSTVASFLVETLIQSGVKRIYGLSGDSLNAITDVVRQNPDFEWVHVRHEEVAAFAAGAEAHLTDSLTVCAGSCGPGNLHLINGLYDCQRNRVPVLAIASHIPSQEIGTSYFQETHPEKIFDGCSHYCQLVSDPAQLPRVLKIAIENAVGKRGVSVVVLSGNISMKELNEAVQPLPIKVGEFFNRPTDEKINQLAQMLNDSKKITIFVGAGCKDAHQQLIEVAGKLQAPIVHAMRGKEYVEYDNPYDVGMTGLLGFSSGYFALASCDTLLMLGVDFPYTPFYPKCKTIQVDMRPENIGRRTRVDLGVVGDIKETLNLLNPRLVQKDNAEHLQVAQKHYAKTRKELDDLAQRGSAQDYLHPQYVTRLVSELADEDAIFTCDVGTPIIWAARYLKMNGKRRLLGSFNHGSMANALAQAIGAQTAYPKRQVIALCGDGGFSMLMGDVLTLRQHNLPIKIIVFNNSTLGFVELEMKAQGFLPTEVSLKNPDFAKLADVVGLKGLRWDSQKDFKDVIKEALKFDGPSLIDVAINHNELSMPPHIDAEQVRGFGMFSLKSVLNGRGNELIDLAKVNLWR